MNHPNLRLAHAPLLSLVMFLLLIVLPILGTLVEVLQRNR